MKKLLIILFRVSLVLGLYAFLGTPANGSVFFGVDDYELLNLLEEDSSEFFVYVGRPTCPLCNEFKPNLEKAIQDNQSLMVYYFNTDENRENEHFAEVLENLGISGVPFLIFVRNGEVIDIHGYADGHLVDDIKNWMENVIK